MNELSTIQKREKLNDVVAVDGVGPGGAYHRYIIAKHGSHTWENGSYSGDVMADIQFQCGPRKEDNSIHGVIDSDLLEIVRHRLKCFQAGQFSSAENEHALAHIEEALMWMNRRVEDRIERNVLGLNKK
jgi:hypothetical protein